MRQRLDDPVFAFSNTTISGASVTTVLANTTPTQNSGTGWMVNSSCWASLISTVNGIAAQLNLIGIIKSS